VGGEGLLWQGNVEGLMWCGVFRTSWLPEVAEIWQKAR
jgi:hypothetical protein